jgi:plasmid stabilization system protein ParE
VKLLWLRAAETGLLKQLDDVSRHHPQAAAGLTWAIEKSLLALTDFPEHGRVKGKRELVIPGTPYIAVDRIKSENIEIVRFRHGAQPWLDQN